jgi:hypothetical protein
MPQPDERVVTALRRALWRHRHPLMYAATRFSSTMLQRIQSVGHRLQRATTDKDR